MINDFSSDEEEEEEEEEEKEVFGSEASSSSFVELEQRCFTISYPSTEILLPPFSVTVLISGTIVAFPGRKQLKSADLEMSHSA